MDVSLLLTLVQTLLQQLDLLDSPISWEIKSLWSYKSQLRKLKNTMSTIQAVLASVERLESQQIPISIPQVTFQRLKDAVYEADDLFDEVATVAHLKELMSGNKLSKEVHLFFSRFNHLTYTFTKSREIRKIRGILDDIAKDHRDFGVVIPQSNYVGVKNIDSSRETHSFVCEEDVIIGRDVEKLIVINMLLHTSVNENVSAISIVGIGGLGKTTLVKLIYNDTEIQAEFSPKMWVCVSDEFNVKSILGQILAKATHGTSVSGLSKDELQTKLRQELNGKKYLLVLDDVWNEDPIKWNALKILLNQGGMGSKIIVTTRSREVAKIVGSNHQTHELEGLSEEDSWNLFERMTLEPGKLRIEAHLVEIGKDIVRKCVNFPLALRVTGSLLRGQGDSTWRNLRNTELANINIDEKGGIIPVLKISYYHLPPHLKCCFSYCSVFPKDYEILKEDLVYLWMAQGFIMPLNGQNLEDLGDEYFMKLLQRCFFQDVKRDETTGAIVSCKMHDLLHDLAKAISGIGFDSSCNDISSLQDEKTHHIILNDALVKMKDVECYITKMKRLRTCLVRLRQSKFSDFYAQFPFEMRGLRVLDLSLDYCQADRCMIKLPSMIGELLHLRYLDLSRNEEFSALPSSITQLYNLQTLKLNSCRGLKELPRKLNKLVNLRHLDIDGCDGLRYMPQGMNDMTSLHKLTRFLLGPGDVVTNNAGAGAVGKLEDLKDLNNLRDYIRIDMKDGWTYDAEKVKEGEYLINKPLLSNIHICWNQKPFHDDEDAEGLLQGLQPHPNTQQLRLWSYPGVGFPSWGNPSLNLSKSLLNLVAICFSGCTRLRSLPLLSQMRHLKVLEFRNLMKLEYVESKSGDELVYFPLLTKLVVRGLPELKGWWKTSSSQRELEATSTLGECEIRSGDNCDMEQSDQKNELQEEAFLVVEIRECHKLKTIPEFPKLKQLILCKSNILLQNIHSLPMGSFQHLSHLRIENDDKMERFSTLGVFTSGRLYSLRSLEIESCSNLKSISGRGVWDHFTALETLNLRDLPELELELEWEEKDDSIHMGEIRENNGVIGGDDVQMHFPWRWIAPTLRHLELGGLPKMVKMPTGMQHLTSLRVLGISLCDNLEEITGWIGYFSSLQHLLIVLCPRVKSLPEEMCHLTSLSHLRLHLCSEELKERCKEPTGADYPKIKHIPNLRIF